MNEAILSLLFIGFIAVVLWVFRRREDPVQCRLENRCQSCGYDLRYSKARCPECATPIPVRAGDHFPLRDDWPATPIQPRQPEADEIPAVVRHTNITGEAILMRDQLIARGIACWVEQHQGARLVGYQTAGPANLNVIVWSADEAFAKDLLDHLTKPRTPVEKVT